jgi:hypothetical protein
MRAWELRRTSNFEWPIGPQYNLGPTTHHWVAAPGGDVGSASTAVVAPLSVSGGGRVILGASTSTHRPQRILACHDRSDYNWQPKQNLRLRRDDRSVALVVQTE